MIGRSFMRAHFVPNAISARGSLAEAPDRSVRRIDEHVRDCLGHAVLGQGHDELRRAVHHEFFGVAWRAGVDLRALYRYLRSVPPARKGQSL